MARKRKRSKEEPKNTPGFRRQREDILRDLAFGSVDRARCRPRAYKREQGPRANVTPGEALSALEVERRLIRAMKTLRALPDPERRFFRTGNGWPPYVHAQIDAYNSAAVTEPRFKPTPGDISDYLTALTWARHLPANDWKILWWRSFDLSFGLIAKYIGRSDETARRRYREVMIDVWSAANNLHAGSAA